MKFLFLFFLAAILCCCSTTPGQTLTYDQTPKEVLIIGTIHTVYDEQNDVYGPLFQIAREYAPQMIFVEFPPPYDEKNWQVFDNSSFWNFLYAFKKESDSLRNSFSYDELKLNRLTAKDFTSLTRSELDTIIVSYTYLRDYSSAGLYKHLRDYGAGRSVPEPYQNENDNLSYPLALSLGLERIYGIDDQKYTAKYLEKLNFISAETLGNYLQQVPYTLQDNDPCRVNSTASLEFYHHINTAGFVEPQNKVSKQTRKYWELRNREIARNFIGYYNAHPSTKAVIIIGAAHAIGIKEQIEKLSNNITVRFIADLPARQD